ncbi:MAG: SGNH/GDSL hydrolase family protein [Gemmatimonadota bacterium]|nr:SGNH/GDSL hydrolase family protein [Gemmatimonadota bacterium]
MAGQLRKLAANLALLGVASLFALTLSEGAVRIIRHRPTVPGANVIRVEPDTLLGWIKKANFEGVRYAPREYTIHESFNSRRIRGPEYPLAKPDGEYRILVLGDSFAQGYTVEFEDLFSEVMKKALNASGGRPVQVINAGTAGWSTDQELLWFRRDGVAYDPDLVILLFYGNDINSNGSDRYWRGRKPWFELVGDSTDAHLELRGVPVPAGPPPTEEVPGLDAGESAGHPGGLKGFLTRHSMLYRDVTRIVKSSPQAFKLARALRLTRETQPQRLAIPLEWDVWRTESRADVRRDWRITEALLEELQNAVRASGAKLLVAHVPAREAVHDWAWVVTRQTFRMERSDFAVNLDEYGLRRICVDQRLECHFLREDFEPLLLPGGAARRQDLYFHWDRHWTALGNRFAGEAIARAVRERFLDAENLHAGS